MNDGSNREAADNIQNSLLASQMAEAEQEFAVMCYTSVGVLEPEQKSKLSRIVGSFVSGWAQPCMIKRFIVVMIVVIMVKFMLMGGDNDTSSSLCVKYWSGCCPH